MKSKYALIALLAIAFYGCDDNTANMGLGMFPGSDQNIHGKLTTFDVTTESVHTGEVYAMTNIGYVGKFTDETFGTYEAGFLSELYCPNGMTFPKPYEVTEYVGGKPSKATGSMVTSWENINLDDKTKNKYIPIEGEDGILGHCQINIHLWYQSYFGDSLTACRLSIYELDENLNKENAYYTNINPDDYYDTSGTGLLGTKAYTAVDLSVSDSIRNLSSYTPSVSIQLDAVKTKRLGAEFLKYKGGDISSHFPDFFKGIYVKSDYGDGTVLYISKVQMNVAFIEYVTDSITGVVIPTSSGKDSVMYSGRSFYATREVIQANQLSNDAKAIQACIDDPNWTYLKSPAGIFTQVTLPISEIAETLEGDTLNAVKLGIPIYNQSNDKKFGMSMPRSVLLVRKKYKDKFFKGNLVSKDTISSLFDASSYSNNITEYTYNNITKLVKNCLEDGEREAAEKKLKTGPITLQITNSEGKLEEKTVKDIKEWEIFSDWNKVLLIPVLVTTDAGSNTGGYEQAANVIGIQHDLKPGYVKLKGGTRKDSEGKPILDLSNVLKLEVVSTNFGEPNK